MSQDPQSTWTAVDTYFANNLIPPDESLDAALRDAHAANLPNIHVAPNQGKLLHLLAQSIHATRILEIGTLAAYSTIWLARALPSTGQLITLESNPTHAQIARTNIARANLSHLIQLLEGPALQTLPTLSPSFDLIFIDADKPALPDYFSWSLKLSHPGTLLLIDNVVRNGAVTNPNSPDPSVQGVRRLIDMLSKEPRISATTLQTVGTKGHDGLLLARVSL